MGAEESFDAGRLDVWLAERLGAESVSVHLEGRPAGGFSAETLLVGATVTRRGATTDERFVLRCETAEPAVYPQQSTEQMPEIEIQHRVMSALAEHTDIPVAPLFGYESTGDILGTPFFVMGFIDGVVPIESPPYTVEGFFTELPPAQRTEMISNGLAAMAAVHAVPFERLGLEWLRSDGRPAGGRRLMDVWRTYGERELAGRAHPDLERAWTWLDDNLPPDSGIGLCWGDPRPGNIIWRDRRPACLTDFEAACAGPPEFDLAWWLMFDRTMHELAGVDRPSGDPDRDEQRRMYFDHAGIEPFDTAAHEVFAAARYCAIVVRVMNRLDQRGLLPADSMVWLDNPASECLRLYLAELGI